VSVCGQDSVEQVRGRDGEAGSQSARPANPFAASLECEALDPGRRLAAFIARLCVVIFNAEDLGECDHAGCFGFKILGQSLAK
jgi:hypothetical protein